MKNNAPIPPPLADRIFEWYCNNELTESIQGDLHEKFYDDLDNKGLRHAQLLYWLSIFRFINKYTLRNRPSATHSNSISMIGNYILITFRSLKKNLTFASINIIGLAIGLASCILIFSYVKKELTFDQFHSNSEQLYRVTNCFERANSTNHWARTPPALAPAIREKFTGVKRTTRLRYTDELLYSVEDRSFYQGNGFYADSLFLEMFDFPLLAGDRSTALDAPGNVVLTEELAMKFFGKKNPIGELITVDNETTLKVTGILAPLPTDSHISFDLLISFSTYVVPDGYLADLNSWGWAGFWTYVELEPNAQSENLEEQITTLYKENYKNRSDVKIIVNLQPLSDLYLGSAHYTNMGESIQVGSKSSVFGLSVIVLLILFIASVNFMNLSTALSLRRAREVGVRKVLGALRSKIRRQFLIESMIVSLISLVLAMTMILTLAPFFSDTFGLALPASPLIYLKHLPLFILCTLIIGLLAGMYPSLVLSAFNPIQALKGKVFSIGSGIWLRKGLIIFQFVIAGSLIVSSLVVVSQMDFIRNKSLGFDQQTLIKMRLGTEEGHYEALRNKLLSNPRVLNLTRASHAFDGSASSGPAWLKGKTVNDSHQLAYYQTEYDFLEVTGIKLLEGRFFSRDFPVDSATAVVLNQSAVAKLGLEEPIGQKINFHNRERTVVGVVEDFHFGSLHTAIGPMGIVMPFVNLEQILVRVHGNDLITTLHAMDADWRAIAGDLPFEAEFVDDGIQAMYVKEDKIADLISTASTLAVILACLGLYALVAFSVQNKLKEIGIRKVLGAPMSGLVFLMAKNYMLLIIISNVIAWPITYYFANQWLDDFAYRIALEPIIFVASGGLLFLIAIATISYQLIKASLINPVIYLRGE
ncbi:MAG: ABC transporter permease [Reichenbachiella sp.]|uniref:ABC transporter permease n=1 Tax=Reichenbachiella sp. TaxID=2184521 RepID=UPI003266EAF1